MSQKREIKMLFNSLIFIAIFAPLCYLILMTCSKVSGSVAVAGFSIVSVAFYAWTDLRYIPLLLGSIVFNYVFGMLIDEMQRRKRGGLFLILGLAGNLSLLMYYKYSGLIANTFQTLSGVDLKFFAPALPIGISFFTFTQIAFLVDAYHGKVSDRNFNRYVLFVTYFPHLIAGPILHHAKMMPQFAKASFGRLKKRSAMIGGAIFLIGLFKKVVLADGVSQFVSPVFDGANQGPLGLSTTEALIGALSYTFQIYFDFSGYTDMAIGLARIMDVRLPENFNSPYKAISISDFWRRWHISLSSFLRDYLYIPLGGNRSSNFRKNINRPITS